MYDFLVYTDVIYMMYSLGKNGMLQFIVIYFSFLVYCQHIHFIDFFVFT